MIANPVFGNELRKSLVRRKPLQCFAIWAAVMAALTYVAVSLPGVNAGIYVQFPQIMLPIIAPAFAAGAFAKEHEQRTWQDLMLTRLTAGEILSGKFLACFIPTIATIIVLMPPFALILIMSSITLAQAPVAWMAAITFRSS